MTKYFTVKTIHYRGLTDQLGTQFSRLYSLGCACKYEYIYTPFCFPRSHGYTSKERLITKIYKFVFFTFPWVYQWRFIEKVINKVFSFFYKVLQTTDYFKTNRDEEIINFLGISNFDNQISDPKFDNYEVLSVDLQKILEGNEIIDLCQLKDVIEGISSSPSLIFEFVWTDKMYHFFPKLDDLLNKSGIDSFEFTKGKLSENYWKESKEKLSCLATISEKKTKLVAHIRLGDSVAVHLANKTLYVIGDYVFSTDIESDVESMKVMFDIDPTRRAISLQQYEIILNKVFEYLGRENIFCTILSDGYERSFNIIMNCILQGKLKLDANELRQLQQIEKALNNDLNGFLINYSDRSIVGESFDNLLKSIHTLASAELVIWGTGGFAFNTHKLFKKNNHFSIILHVTKHENEGFKEISELKLSHFKNDCEK